MSRRTFVRARRVRRRLLQSLEDVRSARLAAESARDQLSTLQGALARSHELATALEATVARIDADLQAGQLKQHEMHVVLDQTQQLVPSIAIGSIAEMVTMGRSLLGGSEGGRTVMLIGSETAKALLLSVAVAVSA